ncbi:hypothetical protein LVJ82_13305 [Vitreoscilla massiliensis]|uniref:Uncharacterized protein n=1 Tax=Vitreoscilla massiliensis TaxID=1689272 RepID=A0ABY4E4S9_9NEIS|nr:hypothetical protein [Vitreoscilla massiliensis]UOO88437.1 hypothetical protein LVJ82_13305 [Vitreoscilla massiliensis]
MLNPKTPRMHQPLRLRLSLQARLQFAQLLLWQVLAFMALLAVFLLHHCDVQTLLLQTRDFTRINTWQQLWLHASPVDVFWHVGVSVLLVLLGKHISINFHRAILPTHLVIEGNQLFWQTAGNGNHMDIVPLQHVDTVLLHGHALDDLLQAAASDISVHLKRRFHPTVIIRQEDFEQADALLQLLPRLMITTHPKTKFQFSRLP